MLRGRPVLSDEERGATFSAERPVVSKYQIETDEPHRVIA